MRVLNLGKLTEIDFHAFNEHIHSSVPSGKIVREGRFGFKPLIGEEMEIYREAKQLVTELYYYRELKDSNHITKSIGSLGGGNHFIELDKDDNGNVYLVIHTGSRNLGKQVAEIYQAKAIKHLTEGADEFEEIIKRTIEESMRGIYSESVNDCTRDESPMVYKPAEEIIANIGETVSFDTIIRPIFNFKASK